MKQLKLSASKWTKFDSCGQEYKMHYIDRIQVFANSVTMWAGNAAEHMVQIYLENPDRRGKPDGIIKEGLVQALNENLPERTDSFTKAYIEFVGSMPFDNTEEQIKTLNIETHKLTTKGVQYKAGVVNIDGYKDGKYLKAPSLFTNVLYKLYDDLTHFFGTPEIKRFAKSVVSVVSQQTIEALCPKGFGGVDKVMLTGIADFLIETDDGRLLCMDCKYSAHDVDNYNLEVDRQMFLYTLILTSLYPNKKIDVGYLNPNQNKHGTAPIKMADMSMLYSEVNSKRLESSIRHIALSTEHDAFVPVCGGGAYKDLSRLCNLKCECPYASQSKGGSENI